MRGSSTSTRGEAAGGKAGLVWCRLPTCSGASASLEDVVEGELPSLCPVALCRRRGCAAYQGAVACCRHAPDRCCSDARRRTNGVAEAVERGPARAHREALLATAGATGIGHVGELEIGFGEWWRRPSASASLVGEALREECPAAGVPLRVGDGESRLGVGRGARAPSCTASPSPGRGNSSENDVAASRRRGTGLPLVAWSTIACESTKSGSAATVCRGCGEGRAEAVGRLAPRACRTARQRSVSADSGVCYCARTV